VEQRSEVQLSISVVSHRQGALVHDLLRDLAALRLERCEFILTVNTPEVLPFRPEAFGFPVCLLENASPKGYGANHNAAFRSAHGRFFAVLNPDIRLRAAPFSPLMGRLSDRAIGIAAPLIEDEQGRIEDSARRVPTPLTIIGKLLRRGRQLDYEIGSDVLYPEWAAGMFLVFRSDVFADLGGFDERYFLYYEDVDICCRARLAGYRVAVDPAARAVHMARRESHRNAGYLRWHLASMARFFSSATFYRSLGLRRRA
jgi:GT2 family glycosyltransferase